MSLTTSCMTSVVETIKAISKEEALIIFKTIALGKVEGNIVRSKTKLTSKQYYSRMSALVKAGIVKRKSGRYNLTAFGKVVYDAQATIENAINDYWKLKAVDSIVEISSDELPKEEFNKIVDILIHNHQIKDRFIITRTAQEKDLSASNNNVEKQKKWQEEQQIINK
jgi:DNA-binding HxlR family transcriptional regulator